jgi:membrane protein YqaA with SNARE-associated domain
VDELVAYALVAAAVLGVNVLPAFGPPTWAILVLFTVNGDYVAPVLVVVGAVAAATGRLLLAHATRRLRRFVPPRERENLEAAGDLLTKRRGRSIAGLALFAVSPVPSAQLFEAAGLMHVRLLPLTAAFFVGRTVSYGLYVGGARTVSETDTGKVLISSLTSPWGVALQLAMLVGLVLLARVDWRRLVARHQG